MYCERDVLVNYEPQDYFPTTIKYTCFDDDNLLSYQKNELKTCITFYTSENERNHYIDADESLFHLDISTDLINREARDCNNKSCLADSPLYNVNAVTEKQQYSIVKVVRVLEPCSVETASRAYSKWVRDFAKDDPVILGTCRKWVDKMTSHEHVSSLCVLGSAVVLTNTQPYHFLSSSDVVGTSVDIVKNFGGCSIRITCNVDKRYVVPFIACTLTEDKKFLLQYSTEYDVVDEWSSVLNDGTYATTNVCLLVAKEPRPQWKLRACIPTSVNNAQHQKRNIVYVHGIPAEITKDAFREIYADQLKSQIRYTSHESVISWEIYKKLFKPFQTISTGDIDNAREHTANTTTGMCGGAIGLLDGESGRFFALHVSKNHKEDTNYVCLDMFPGFADTYRQLIQVVDQDLFGKHEDAINMFVKCSRSKLHHINTLYTDIENDETPQTPLTDMISCDYKHLVRIGLKPDTIVTLMKRYHGSDIIKYINEDVYAIMWSYSSTDNFRSKLLAYGFTESGAEYLVSEAAQDDTAMYDIGVWLKWYMIPNSYMGFREKRKAILESLNACILV